MNQNRVVTQTLKARSSIRQFGGSRARACLQTYILQRMLTGHEEYASGKPFRLRCEKLVE